MAFIKSNGWSRRLDPRGLRSDTDPPTQAGILYIICGNRASRPRHGATLEESVVGYGKELPYTVIQELGLTTSGGGAEEALFSFVSEFAHPVATSNEFTPLRFNATRC